MPTLSLFFLYWTVISLFFPHSLNPGLSPCLSKQLSSFWNGHWSRPKLSWQWFVWRESGPICSLSTGDVGPANQSPPPQPSSLPSPLLLNTQREDNENRERAHRTSQGSDCVWAPTSSRLVHSPVRASAGRMRLELNGHSSNADELLDTCPGDWCCWWLWLLILAL